VPVVFDVPAVAFDLLVVLDLLVVFDLLAALDLVLGAGACFLGVVVSAAPYTNAAASARTAADRKIKTSSTKIRGRLLSLPRETDEFTARWQATYPSNTA
jgi:hypothetical protein